MISTAPPKLCVALFPLVLKSRKTGSSMLTISARRCLRNTWKSARNNEVKTICSGGPALGSEPAATLAPSVLATDLTPGQPDEHVFERHVTMGDLAHARIVLVLFDQVVRGLGRKQRA